MAKSRKEASREKKIYKINTKYTIYKQTKQRYNNNPTPPPSKKKERKKGKERKRKERKGKERKGKERKGREGKGRERKGKEGEKEKKLLQESNPAHLVCWEIGYCYSTYG